MPARNVVKIDVPQSYYHVYAQARGRQKLFRDDDDYEMFLSLFARSLSKKPQTDVNRAPYAHLRSQLELLGYCLLPNQFHLLLYQTNEGAMSRLMRGVMTSYTRYYNKKYNLSGSLFATTYKASRISENQYLPHISRFIHLQAKDWQAYPHSSIHSYYMGRPEWLQPERLINMFESLPHYADFLDDRADYKASLEDIKEELAI